jgi:hypothetical protein
LRLQSTHFGKVNGNSTCELFFGSCRRWPYRSSEAARSRAIGWGVATGPGETVAGAWPNPRRNERREAVRPLVRRAAHTARFDASACATPFALLLDMGIGIVTYARRHPRDPGDGPVYVLLEDATAAVTRSAAQGAVSPLQRLDSDRGHLFTPAQSMRQVTQIVRHAGKRLRRRR